jgi:hypothetical protein
LQRHTLRHDTSHCAAFLAVCVWLLLLYRLQWDKEGFLQEVAAPHALRHVTSHCAC